MVLPFVQSLLWSLKLNDYVPLELDVRVGANEMHLDLSQLNVTDLQLRTGASETLLTLPAQADHNRAEAHCGLASVRINIPESVAARIRASGGLSNISIDRERFPRSGGYYQSPEYESPEHKVEMVLSMGVGSVTVR
jgi:hypothetical protein